MKAKNKRVRWSYNEGIKIIGLYVNINQKMYPEVSLMDNAVEENDTISLEEARKLLHEIVDKEYDLS